MDNYSSFSLETEVKWQRKVNHVSTYGAADVFRLLEQFLKRCGGGVGAHGKSEFVVLWQFVGDAHFFVPLQVDCETSR